MGHVAASASGRRLRTEARLHVLLPSARRARSPTTASTSGSCWSPPARTTRSRDTHWYRPDFDQALVREAEARRRDLSGRDAARARSARGRSRRSLEGDARRPLGPHHGALRDRRQRAARVPAPRARPATTRRSAGCRRRRGSTRTSKASSAGIDCTPPTKRRPTRSTTRRCIMCFRAAGSGCCGSTTASPAPAPR